MPRRHPNTVTRSHHAVSLQQAALGSPTLARLAALGRESAGLLRTVTPLLPPSLRSCVTAGPIDGADWCLLIKGTAAAAKIRQLLPRLLATLHEKGHQVNSIRLKIQTPLR